MAAAGILTETKTSSMQQILKRLAFSIYSQGREVLIHKPNIPEAQLSDYKNDVPTYRLYSPPYIIRSPKEMPNGLLKCTIDPQIISPVCEQDHLLHVTYDMSPAWLIVVICDERAELLEHFSVPLDRRESRHSTASYWFTHLQLVWKPILALTGNVSFRWHVVITKLGAMNEFEELAWQSLTKSYVERFDSCSIDLPLPDDLAWLSITLLAFESPSIFETCTDFYSNRLTSDQAIHDLPNKSSHQPHFQQHQHSQQQQQHHHQEPRDFPNHENLQFQFVNDTAYAYSHMQRHHRLAAYRKQPVPCIKVFDHESTKMKEFHQSRWEVRTMKF
jgi:hypothetical protein